jgi:hypothetical protein
MSDTTVEVPEDREFVGYPAAAKYLGLKTGTLSFYMGRGYGPKSTGRRTVGQYNQWVFLQSELDRWKANRPGRGARTDRMHAGAGNLCTPCEGNCVVKIPD